MTYQSIVDHFAGVMAVRPSVRPSRRFLNGPTTDTLCYAAAEERERAESFLHKSAR